MTKLINATISIYDNLLSDDRVQENTEQMKQINTTIEGFKIEQDQLQKELEALQKLGEEISFMKEGSIARIEQITTISKMRIWIPKHSSDVLYNVSYSENSMKKINERLKELFIFDE